MEGNEDVKSMKVERAITRLKQFTDIRQMNGSHKYFLLVPSVDEKDYTQNWRMKGFVIRTQTDSFLVSSIFFLGYITSDQSLLMRGKINVTILLLLLSYMHVLKF